ncbi:MAG: hypothetical protein U0746_04800 [Gemmataceae bacterium]
MEQVIQAIAEKLGLSADAARGAVEHVLGFLRGQVPAESAPQFDKAIGAAAGELPTPSITDLLTKTGLDVTKLHGVFEMVMGFLKDKLPADLLSKIDMASVLKQLGGEGAGGLLGKIMGMFGGGDKK